MPSYCVWKHRPEALYHTIDMKTNNLFKKENSVTKAILFAVLAALLYALMTPVSKLLQTAVPPVAEAGLLYLGAGLGMTVIVAVRKAARVHSDKTVKLQSGQGAESASGGAASAADVSAGRFFAGTKRPSIGRADLKYVLAMIALDAAAPILLLLGLSMCAPESVSLLNNFEIVATAVIAAALFREKIGRRLAASIGIITLSCILLSLDGGLFAGGLTADGVFAFSKGSLFVIGACVCWGFENNCTSSLSDKDTCQIVLIKGLGSGTASLIISAAVGERLPGLTGCLPVLVLGFLAIGLSVYFYVLAQNRIGAARTSSYYAVAPFIGVLLALLFFREMPGVLFWAALAVMALGVWLNVRDAQMAERNSSK